jgi:Ca2+-binding RTX toxin-like protein
MLETLEDRLTPSTVSFDNGVLTYQAGAGVASNLFYHSSYGVDFTFTDDEYIDTGDLPLDSANQGGIPDTVTVQLANVTQVVIHLGSGNDHATILGTQVPTVVVGQNGNNDIVVGGVGGTDGLGALVTVDGGGHGTFTIDDQTGVDPTPFVIDAGTVNSMPYSGITHLRVNVSAYTPSVQVNGTAEGVDTTLDLRSATNGVDVSVADSSSSLADIQSPLKILTSDSSYKPATVAFRDGADQQFHIYRVGAHFSRSWFVSSYETVARDGHTIATLTGTPEVTIEGSGADDVFGVDGCTGPVNLFAGNSGNNLAVVGTAHGLDDIAGPVTLFGGGLSPASDHLSINDSNASSGHTYDLHTVFTDGGVLGPIQNTALDRDGTTLVYAADVQILSIATSKADSVFNANMTAGGPAINLSMNAANDTLAAQNLGNDFFISGHNAGKLVNAGGTIQFSGVQSLVGGNGSDTFHFTNAGRLDGSLDGGESRLRGAVKTLDYSACTKFVYVNLNLQTATGVKGKVTNIDNVTGGSVRNLLVGDGNANVLIGGNGSNVIIGGGGGDTIRGGTASDLLIAGSTAYESNSAALMAIFKAWTQGRQTYAERIAALRAGVSYAVPGVPLHKYGGRALAALNPQTVPGDDPACQLTGGGGLDWFWATSPTEVLDLQSGDVIN